MGELLTDFDALPDWVNDQFLLGALVLLISLVWSVTLLFCLVCLYCLTGLLCQWLVSCGERPHGEEGERISDTHSLFTIGFIYSLHVLLASYLLAYNSIRFPQLLTVLFVVSDWPI